MSGVAVCGWVWLFVVGSGWMAVAEWVTGAVVMVWLKCGDYVSSVMKCSGGCDMANMW